MIMTIHCIGLALLSGWRILSPSKISFRVHLLIMNGNTTGISIWCIYRLQYRLHDNTLAHFLLSNGLKWHQEWLSKYGRNPPEMYKGMYRYRSSLHTYILCTMCTLVDFSDCACISLAGEQVALRSRRSFARKSPQHPGIC